MPLVSTSDLAVHYGADIIFSGVNLDINERARIGIVGPNGGGKTSLLRVLVGEQDANGGHASQVDRVLSKIERGASALRALCGVRWGISLQTA